MKKLSSLLFIGALFVSMQSFGQKIQTIEGDLSFMKNVKILFIEFDFSEFGVGDFETEKEYTDKKVSEYNEKVEGKGETWLNKWDAAKTLSYAPKFMELFNKKATSMGFKVSQKATDADYKLVVKTTFLEPGFNIGIVKRPSGVSFQYIFIDVKTNKVVARFAQEKVPGSSVTGNDMDVSNRIQESYAKAGKMLIAMMAKNMK